MFFFVRFGAAIAAYGRVGVVGVLDVSVDLVDERPTQHAVRVQFHSFTQSATSTELLAPNS